MNPTDKKTKTGLQIQKYFITGLATLLPLWITFIILKIIFTWISNVTRPILEPIIELSIGKEPASILLSVTSFIFTLFIVYISGMLATNIASRKILIKFEALLIKIPLLKDIYSPSRELLKFVFAEKKEYGRVVLIEWPAKEYYCIGFVTSEITLQEPVAKKILSIFIPTTPNPTTGYLTFLSEDKTIPLEIGTDDAIKMIVSGGVVGAGITQNVFSKINMTGIKKPDTPI